MPTKEEFEELVEYCSFPQYEKQNGRYGQLFTNSKNEVKTEDRGTDRMADTTSIKNFYIGILLGLLLLTFLILLPRFIRGTKGST